jgi:hypothetical protein
MSRGDKDDTREGTIAARSLQCRLLALALINTGTQS